MKSGASFSEDRKYRYGLWRIWKDDQDSEFVHFCMLNPSTADENVNDPTIERCIRRAKNWGYDGIIITNLFAFRSTDPKELKNVEDPVGPENDDSILYAAAYVPGITVCGWGKHGHLHDRGTKVHQMLSDKAKRLFALKTNKDGSPAHPLYIGYDVEPFAFRLPRSGV